MDNREAFVTGYEILGHLDTNPDIKEKLLNEVDLSNEGFEDMMTTLLDEVSEELTLRQEQTCPQCEGSNLTEDKTRCWDCDGGPG